MAPSYALSSRPGDPQAAKAGIAAAAAGAALEVTGPPPASAPAGAFGARLMLACPGGQRLAEGNAAARALLGAASAPAAESWLDWEEATLRAAVYRGAIDGGAPLAAALAELEAALDAGGRLPGVTPVDAGALSLAEVALFGTLAGGAVGDVAGVQLPPNVAAFCARLSAMEPVRAGLQAVCGGEGAEPAAAMTAVLAADRAAAAAAEPKLPQAGKRNVLITSALPYVNNVPHLGNIIGCVLSADCYARYCRARGYNAIYVCGTDEYGTATETKAMEEGLTPAQICDKYHAIHAAIYEWFDCEFDNFGRTPTRAQTEICQAMYKDLDAAGMVVEKEVEQLYSEALRKYLADRFVEGTCPRCKYEDARGDQCDACQALLNPTELINPRCKFTGTTPVLRRTAHMYLDLPALSAPLEAYVEAASASGGWTANCLTTTQGWFARGLQHRAITRDLSWGTPVPRPGYEDKVFYVWFDAPIGYISITANYTPEWRRWWCAPGEVELVQFMGKDNIPFHTIIFPATLLGTGQPWTMMSRISVTEYLNYEGGKFSKSRGVGVFGNDAKDTGIPVEVWRYYLLGNRPEAADTDFKWADLAAKNNAELSNNLGNFIMRALSFAASRCGGAMPASGDAGAGAVAELSGRVAELVEQYVEAMEACKIRAACGLAMAVSKAGNAFFQETQPWVVFKSDPAHCGTLIAGCIGLVRVLATLLAPFMPSIAKRIAAQLGLRPEALTLDDAFLAGVRAGLATLLPAGHPLGGKPEPLFRNIGDDEVEALRARFAGSQADRAAGATSSAAAASSASKPAAPAKQAAAKGAVAKAEDKKDKAEGKKDKAEGKKDKAEGKKEKSAPAGKAAEVPVDVSRLDLRVGRILKASKHPEADSLYVEEIDVGEGAPRTVISGLVKFIPEAEMQGRRVVVLANLKPVNMRGIKSHAMVMCASSADGATVELVTPPEGAAIGERVTVEGFPGAADEQLNPKKKVFEAVAPDLASDDACVATYKGVPFMTSAGPCTVQSVKGGAIK
eukprot:jgi/Tetstr1/440620/TSEL_028930.t1